MILWHFCLLLVLHHKDNLNTSHRVQLQFWYILWVPYQHFIQCLQEEIFSAALSEMQSKMYKYSLHWSDSFMSSGPGVYNTQLKCCNRMCLSSALHPKIVLAGPNSHRQILNRSQSSFRAYQWLESKGQDNADSLRCISKSSEVNHLKLCICLSSEAEMMLMEMIF